MIALLAAPFLVAVILGRIGPRVARDTQPGVAAWFVATSSVIAAGACAASLGLAGWFAVADLPWVAGRGNWSTAALARETPIPVVVAAAALVIVGVMAAVTGYRVVGGARRLARAHAVHGGADGALLVIQTDEVDAYALPRSIRHRGVVVVTRGLLVALDDPAHRRAVVEHEQAHLRGHHHFFRVAVQAAVTVNPLLRPYGQAIEDALERWADREAARHVDAIVVAEAIVLVASKRPVGQGPRPQFAVTGSGVARRVDCLVTPSETTALVPCVLATAAFVLTIVPIVLACRSTEAIFEHLMR